MIDEALTQQNSEVSCTTLLVYIWGNWRKSHREGWGMQRSTALEFGLDQSSRSALAVTIVIKPFQAARDRQTKDECIFEEAGEKVRK